MFNTTSLIRQPALHFAALGTLLFLGTSLFPGTWPLGRGADESSGAAVAERPTLEIASSRLAEAETRFRRQQRRPPTAAEKAELVRDLVDEEVLFRHAIELGLHQAEVPRRRLAQIAAFVEPATHCAADAGAPAAAYAAAGELDGCAPAANPEQTAALALRAVELGLHEGDFVTRRVLIDAARRLIRGAARLIEPGEQAMADYLEANAEAFRGADRFRVSHVFFSDSRRQSPAQDAAALLDRLRRDAHQPEAAAWTQSIAAMADPGLVPPHLPLLERRALERRFGAGFVRRVAELPAGEWSGPVRSRYGEHLVFVHEHRTGRVPEASEVADVIRARLREEAADRWLAERLRQLRGHYEIVTSLEERAIEDQVVEEQVIEEHVIEKHVIERKVAS